MSELDNTENIPEPEVLPEERPEGTPETAPETDPAETSETGPEEAPGAAGEALGDEPGSEGDAGDPGESGSEAPGTGDGGQAGESDGSESSYDRPPREEHGPSMVADVRHGRGCRRLTVRAGKFKNLGPGKVVVTDSDVGPVLGMVVTPPRLAVAGETPSRRILRMASDHDLVQDAENQDFEDEARVFCVEKIQERQLPMHLVTTEVSLDRRKLIFFFTAEGRIDFRDLVKDLASQFRTRIEMRQIGSRDETKMIGGLGPCGQEVCCHRWLDQFVPISIKMAKQQDLSLNPAKISGLCGRLMCCLVYEYDPKAKRAKRRPDGAPPEAREHRESVEETEETCEPVGEMAAVRPDQRPDRRPDRRPDQRPDRRPDRRPEQRPDRQTERREERQAAPQPKETQGIPAGEQKPEERQEGDRPRGRRGRRRRGKKDQRQTGAAGAAEQKPGDQAAGGQRSQEHGTADRKPSEQHATERKGGETSGQPGEQGASTDKSRRRSRRRRRGRRKPGGEGQPSGGGTPGPSGPSGGEN